MPLSNSRTSDLRALGVAIAGGATAFIVVVSVASAGLLLKQERKHKLIVPSKGCYAWHDGRIQCNPLLQDTQCPPVWKCNGRQETNDPRCCNE